MKLTDPGYYDKVYEVVVNGKSTGHVYKTRKAAEQAALSEAWRGKVKVLERAGSFKKEFDARFKNRFRTPTGKLTVPAGTMVYVYRNVNVEGTWNNPKAKTRGWVKYGLKAKRTFEEQHQVTSMNQGLMRAEAIKLLNSKQWIVFHTEEEDYPLPHSLRSFRCRGTKAFTSWARSPRKPIPFMMA